jgi:flavin reductase (DIM6/NTAB) family NADH-FMN oxidoreductase RutF
MLDENFNDVFEKIDVKKLNENFFHLIDNDWMLVTAGNIDNFNTMTASWGTFGILWNKPVAIVFIRPHRYTFEFIEKSTYYTLTFFDNQYRNILNFCGQHTGKKVDKIKETGLAPVLCPSGAITYQQGRLVFECKKLYSDDFKSDRFKEVELIHRAYPSKDFHRFYVGEIVNCYHTLIKE